MVGKLKSWVGSRFRADVVEAFEKAFRSGTIEVKRRGPVPRPGPPSASVASAALAAPDVPSDPQTAPGVS